MHKSDSAGSQIILITLVVVFNQLAPRINCQLTVIHCLSTICHSQGNTVITQGPNMAQMSDRLDMKCHQRQELMYDVYFVLIIGKINKFSEKNKTYPLLGLRPRGGGKN